LVPPIGRNPGVVIGRDPDQSLKLVEVSSHLVYWAGKTGVLGRVLENQFFRPDEPNDC
jgi:hypothetical protein